MRGSLPEYTIKLDAMNITNVKIQARLCERTRSR